MDRSQWETTEAEQLQFRGTKGRRELKRKRLSHENSDYSIPLIGIAQKCLKFDPAERPIPQALLDLVRKYMRVPIAGDADELRIRLDDHHGIGKEY